MTDLGVPAARLQRRLAVVADDLTGAADAVAPFAGRGLRVSLALAGPPRADVDVIALVTDNRWRDERESADRMASAVTAARDWGAGLLFVKVDSTLRGDVRADVAAALSAWGVTGAIGSPAFPAQGRVVRDGVLVVRGEAVPGRVADRFPAGVRAYDAESDEDLGEIARRVLRDGAVAVGSGGLAAALAEALAPVPTTSEGPDDPRHADHKGPMSGVLVVVGTAHAVARGQAAALVGAGAVAMEVRAVADPDSSAPGPSGGDEVCRRAAEVLRGGGSVVLTADADGEVPPDSPRAVALAGELAGVVRDILVEAPTAGLVLTGGATALAVAEALGADELRVLGEVEAGLPYGELLVSGRRIPVVTKSGGFGTETALRRAVEALEDCA